MPYIGKEPKTITTISDLSVTGDTSVTGTVNPSGDTASGDAAAVGFTSTEGLILTGQGSTSDVVIKNDADTTVCFVPTGTDDLKFNDTARIIMGAGDDMQIIHDGSNSIISDNGTGNLVLRSDAAAVEIDFNTDETAALFNHNGSVELYHDNSKKLETASTGVDITGGFTATDGCTITTADNDAQLTLKSTDADSTTGPELNLVRDSASPADGDGIGRIKFTADNDAGEATTYSTFFTTLRDASDGSEDGQVIHYAIRAGSLVDHLRIGRGSAGGQSEVTVNEGGADIDFRAESSGNANMFIVDGGNNSVMVGDNTGASYSDGGLFTRHAGGANNSPLCVVNGTTSGTRRMVDFFVGTGTSRVGSIQSTDSATAFNTSSDYRLKENVADMTGAIDRVKALAPKRFNFIVSPDTTVDGFLAHEVSSIVPEAISGEKDEVATWGKEEKLPDGVKVGDNKLDDDGNTIPIMQGIDHSKLVPLLTAALKEAVAKIESLEARVTTLEG